MADAKRSTGNWIPHLSAMSSIDFVSSVNRDRHSLQYSFLNLSGSVMSDRMFKYERGFRCSVKCTYRDRDQVGSTEKRYLSLHWNVASQGSLTT